ncbi:MAG TPA: hypothetical protein PKW80_12745 [Bacteroidales bacterium]|nr:hypothetical protein [Bacteroidales bacterium]
MDRKELKKKIFDFCMQLQVRQMESVQEEMHEAFQNAKEYGTPEDWLDTYKMDMLNKRDACGVQLQKIIEEIKTLERIDPSIIIDEVTFGAVVFTETQKLIIATGMGKIIIDDETYHAISPTVPLYHAIKGLKAGDTFEFRGEKNKILEVF